MASAAPRATFGAYGLRLSGEDLEAAAHLLVPAQRSWPGLELRRRVGGPFPRELDRASETEARFHLENGGTIEIDFREAVATVTTPALIGVEELVHPYLAPIAAMFAYWLGRESFHAGAFASDGDVWAVLGDRESGKSSTLGWMAEQGTPIVCDDMLVIDGLTAFAGPRSIDLRGDVAEMLGAGEPLGVVGARERWRLTVPQVPAELTLVGTVHLAWGAESVRSMRPSERVSRLVPARGVRIPSRTPETVMAVASLPGWEVTRPRGPGSLAETGRLLRELVSA